MILKFFTLLKTHQKAKLMKKQGWGSPLRTHGTVLPGPLKVTSTPPAESSWLQVGPRPSPPPHPPQPLPWRGKSLQTFSSEKTRAIKITIRPGVASSPILGFLLSTRGHVLAVSPSSLELQTRYKLKCFLKSLNQPLLPPKEATCTLFLDFLLRSSYSTKVV